MLYAPIHGNLPELKTFRKQKISRETTRGTNARYLLFLIVHITY